MRGVWKRRCGRRTMETSVGLFLKLAGFVLVLLSPRACGADGEEDLPSTGNDSLSPHFDLDVAREVTAAAGRTAFLRCRVQQLGDKAVSWIRQRDLHILTVGLLTYTSDERFQAVRPRGSDTWTLQLRYPQLRDSGVYECQVNTEPKISLAFQLRVVEWRARLLGPADLYVRSGSSVALTCVVGQGPHDLGTVLWYREGSPLGPPRAVVHAEWRAGELTSRLVVPRAAPRDSGNYSCVPTAARGASALVHVISGEYPAAMQHGNSPSRSVSLSVYVVVCCYTVMLIKSMR
ncbi:zwei Ig domain protein zig-8-like [Bacillus rossius redtenbacheri]|uniref:zwei Ig domain protein zig-8-like n=1 Tax=Bacillus rossius redtenbacheri TaxID=93214 RepID=UPI002FDEDA78